MSNPLTKRLRRRNSVTTISNFSSTDSSQSFDANHVKNSANLILSGETAHSSDTFLQQQRWKNKTFLQSHSVNLRVSQNRLRVNHSQELLNELRNRRKIRPTKRRPSRKKISTPLERFQRIVSLVRLLLRCLLDYRRVTLVSQVNQMSFAMLSSDLVATRSYRHGLTFDPNEYKVAKETLLTDKVREILTLVPYQRTKQQLDYALKCLRAGVEEFAEFPLSMQHALVKVAWLDEFEPKRIIIRQGYKAETFYFIISGTALVTKNRISPNGEGYVETVSILKRGKSFGELAIMRHEQRTNNVVSQTHISLLTVGRKDFVDIFMHRMEGGEPEFISFLRKLPEFIGFPFNKIPRSKPKICAFTYFRVGVVICADSDKSDMIVIVRSGVCRVVKCLNATKPNLPGLQELPSGFDYETPELHRISNLPASAIGVRRSVPSKSSPSSVSQLTGPKHPTFLTRQSLTFVRRRDPSLREQLMNGTEPWFENNFRFPSELQREHQRKIQKDYQKWQKDHPISLDTFALLMTGREPEEELKVLDAEEADNKINDKRGCNTYRFWQETEKPGGELSDKSSAQSNFQMLNRNRNSGSSVMTQLRGQKIPSMSASLPKLPEKNLSHSTRSNRFATGHMTSNKSVYIHVQTLREKDVFGLLPIVFDKSEGATPVSLISDGAECILINKDFFIKYFDDEQRERLIRMIRPYPSQDTLQTNMQNQTNWDAYKFMTVRSHVTKQDKTKLHRGFPTPQSCAASGSRRNVVV